MRKRTRANSFSCQTDSVSETGVVGLAGSARQTGSVRETGPVRVLVHMCCGPCSIYPLKAILKEKAQVFGFFHNPNIHPYSEFKLRLAAVKKLAALLSLEVIYDEEYRPTAFIKGMKASLALGGHGDPGGHGGPSAGKPPEGPRCVYCYSERLEATARAAKAHGFDAFSSSLLYSKYQNHEEIKRLGTALAEKYGVDFYYEDFRPGWQDGIGQSKEMGLYRQKYCGCIYSKIERYSKKKKGGGG